MIYSPLEFLAEKYGNVVKYDASGNVAGIFVRFQKMKSSDLVAGLPDHTHPAFIVNGVEQDYILLGKYKAGENGDSNGPLLSLPNIPPIRSLGADQCLSRMKLAGPGITGMTCADYGFIKLLAQKNGWVPHGNNNWGQDYRDGTAWQVNQQLTIGTVRAYKGYLYTCKIAHTTAAELKPDLAPTYWEKGKLVGGISWDNSQDNNYQSGYRTLNGTGPLDWYLGNDPGNLADIIGSSMEQQYGYRIVDMELQILENNNAADPEADLSATSAEWKAILPNQSDDGYTLVAPGTAGTLHWRWLNSKITLDAGAPPEAEYDNEFRGTSFKDLAVNSTNLPFIPHIVKELGLFPTGAGDTAQGYYYIQMTHEERFPRRGGDCSSTSGGGLGCVSSSSSRAAAGAGYGARPRFSGEL